MSRRIVLSILACIVLSSGTFMASSIVEYNSTSSEPIMAVVPAAVCPHVVGVGETFTVNFTVTDVENLFAWQIKVHFDPTILGITPVQELERWLPSDHVFSYTEGTGGLIFLDPIIGDDYLLWGCSLVGTELPRFNGTGTLCQINFTAVAAGISSIELDDLDSVLVEGTYADEIPSVKVNSFIDVGPTLSWIYTDCERRGMCKLVTIEPSYETYVFSCPNKIEFSVSLDGTEQCNVTVPHLKKGDMTVWDGPFEVLVDGDRINHTVDFNATHTVLRFRHASGVHNVEITEGTVMCLFGDLDEDGYVGIKDIFIVAKNFGKSCP